MSKLTEYIEKLKQMPVEDRIERLRKYFPEMFEEKNYTSCEIELDTMTDISKCPRCGAEILDKPYPSLHLASTIYKCNTMVIEMISGDNKIIDRLGNNCVQLYIKY